MTLEKPTKYTGKIGEYTTGYFPAPENVKAHEPYLLGKIVYVPLTNAKKGESVTVDFKGQFLLAVTGKFVAGAPIYLDTAARTLSATQNNNLIGYALTSGENELAEILI